MNRRLDLDLTARDAVPRPRAPEGRPAADNRDVHYDAIRRPQDP